jgi:hypothetical protein
LDITNIFLIPKDLIDQKILEIVFSKMKKFDTKILDYLPRQQLETFVMNVRNNCFAPLINLWLKKQKV